MSAKKRFSLSFDFWRTVAAIALSIIIAIVIILIVSDEPAEAIRRFLIGPVSSTRYFVNVLDLMIPLMFTGLAVSLLFRVGIFNLAAEGMFYTGGLVAAAIGCMLSLPAGLHPLLGVLLGGLAGGLIALIPASLKTKFGANEVVSSLMLNYVIFKTGDYILKTFIRDPASIHVTSYEYKPTAYLPKIVGNVHLGMILIILLLVFFYLFLYKTRWGYEIRTVGENPEFARYAGMKVTRVILLAQLLGGVVAGLGGASHILGATQRFTWEWRSGYGWDGIVVAIVAGNNPKLVPVAAFILAYLRIGSDIMSRMTDVQNEVVAIIQGVIIVLIAATGFLKGLRKKMVVRAATAELEAGEGAQA